MSGVKAYVAEDFMLRTLRVMFEQEIGDGLRKVWAPGGDTVQVYSPGDAAVEFDPLTPLNLRDDEARALLQALLNHFQGGDDTRALRRDYDAERKRVDQFIAHLTGGTS